MPIKIQRREDINKIRVGSLIYFEFCESWKFAGWHSGVYLITGMIELHPDSDLDSRFPTRFYLLTNQRIKEGLPARETNPKIHYVCDGILGDSIETIYTNGNLVYLLTSEEN
jgi:hypothetical protein